MVVTILIEGRERGDGGGGGGEWSVETID